MNIQDYENSIRIFQKYAETVMHMVKKSISNHNALNPSHCLIVEKTEFRAKEPDSLRKKLLYDKTLKEKLNRDNIQINETNIDKFSGIEKFVFDLAGCRVTFSSESDVDIFKIYHVILSNFNLLDFKDLCEENGYDARHYSVTLKAGAPFLKEYNGFKNLPCEIQIHTLSNNIYASIAHNTVYKTTNIPNFGDNLQKAINNNVNDIRKITRELEYRELNVKILDNHYKRGADLYFKITSREIESSQDNNQRYEYLIEYKTYVLPNLNEIPKEFSNLINILEAAFKASQYSKVCYIESFYDKLPSKTFLDILDICLDILEYIYSFNLKTTFETILNFYLKVTNEEEKERIRKSIYKLVSYDSQLIKKNGFSVQQYLVSILGSWDTETLKLYKRLAFIIIEEVLRLEFYESKLGQDQIIIAKERVQGTEQLADIRNKAINTLKELYNLIENDDEKNQIFSTFKIATLFPEFNKGNEELLEIIIQNARTIINFYTDIIPNESYEIMRSLEKKAVTLYHNLNAIFADIKDEVFKENIKDLIEKIEQFRDILNGDAEFVIYKTLIGYDSVLPHSWKNREWLYPSMEQKEQYISDKLQDYVDSINENSYELWQQRILCCMQTKSSDGADFLHLIEFLKVIGKQKPQFLLFLIEKHTDSLSNFLVIILDNLLLNQETKENTYLLMRKWIEEGQYLIECARVFSSGNKELDLSLLKLLFDKALTFQDIPTLIQILVVVVVNYKEGDKWLLKELFLPCLQELTKVKNTVWMKELWYLKEWATLVSDLDKQGVEFLLNNLLHVENIESHAEKILMPIAFKMPETVLELFRKRIALNETNERSLSYTYNLIPYEFYILKEPLSKNAKQTVDIVSSWYDEQSENFEHQGARLLSIIFPDFPKPFETKLLALIHSGEDKNFTIVMSILKNYQGKDFLYELCKALIKVLSLEDKRISDIKTLLISTPLVTGKWGIVEAYKSKIEEIEKWLKDENEKVQKFAISMLKPLKNREGASRREVMLYR